MRHSCGLCGAFYGCGGGLGTPCVCGHRDLLREDRRCLPCRAEDPLRGAAPPDFINRDPLAPDLNAIVGEGRLAPPAAGPPMYRFVHGLLDPFAPQEVAPPPLEPHYIDWAKIPRNERCRCNKCSRDAQAQGVVI